MNKHARSFRMCMLQFKDGRREEMRLEQPVPDGIRVAFVQGWEGSGRVFAQTRPVFGYDLYRWNGRDLTVQGWPVYR